MNKQLILGIILLVIAGAIAAVVTSPRGERGVSDNDSAKSTGTTSVGATLDLHGQGLTKVPKYVFSRTNVQKLDLSGNRLDGALPAEIRNLKNLRTLDLHGNKFTGVPAEIGQLQYLEVLDLSDNLLTGLPYELGNLHNLKLLNLSGNDYSKIDLAEIRKNLPQSTVVQTQ